jgi:hypothetical protein
MPPLWQTSCATKTTSLLIFSAPSFPISIYIGAPERQKSLPFLVPRCLPCPMLPGTE